VTRSYKLAALSLSASYCAAIIILAVVACGANARDKTIHASFAGVSAVRDSFVTWDAKHQAELVDQAKTLSEGHASLDAYRQKRERVVELFEAAYRLIAAAAIAQHAQDLTAISDAVLQLEKALHEIGVPP
jgi:hypothetical protein